ncbi:MAG: septum formation protein Maf, partial [Marinicaulis sp.]|nr:septum formation protein Maf [Marinicaulis sp.]
MSGAPFILASASPRRRALLAQIGVKPAKIIPADLDETPMRGEIPRDYVGRISQEKAAAIAAKHEGSIILAADTTVACGRRILPKTDDEQSARACLMLMSGCAHRVLTGVALIGSNGATAARIVETRVKVRRLDKYAMDEYIECGEWNGKAGGYAIQG